MLCWREERCDRSGGMTRLMHHVPPHDGRLIGDGGLRMRHRSLRRDSLWRRDYWWPHGTWRRLSAFGGRLLMISKVLLVSAPCAD